jgi:uncharacterized protein YjbI with pentapeptide repeats
MKPEEIQEVIRLHALFLEDSKDGKRADLCGADLCGADLYRANLSGADLSEAKLRDTDLSDVKIDSIRYLGRRWTEVKD